MSSVPASADIARFLDRKVQIGDPGDDAGVAALLHALHSELGEQISMVLLYGSYLRGSVDTLLDFYVVVEDYERAFGSKLRALSAFVMPPNVYYLSLTVGDDQVRAKYAVVSRRQLQRQMRSFHPYFWARFTQPCRLVYVRDEAARSQLVSVLCAAVDTFVARVVPMMAGSFSAAAFWNAGFSLTYRAELRAESKARVESIFEHDQTYYATLLGLYVNGVLRRAEAAGGESELYQASSASGAAAARWSWRWTIAMGKLLSVARLVKGAVTFNDPIDYILWKVERHSGIHVEASERQRRYPLIFAWPLAWRLFRLGAFR